MEKLVELLEYFVSLELKNILFEQPDNQKILRTLPRTFFHNYPENISMGEKCLEIAWSIENLTENRMHSISFVEMKRAIERLPKILRDKFPNIGYSVIRASKEMLPFDLKKIWEIHPKILEDQSGFIFGLHLGDPWGEPPMIPTQDEINDVINFINMYMKNRGWHIQNWDSSQLGGTLKIEITPEKTQKLTNVPKVLYHLTDTKNISSIRSSGLKPRASKNPERSYTARVYVFTDPTLLQQQIEQNIEAHQDSHSWFPKLTQTPDMSVVQINTAKLRKGTKFYKDPEFSGEEGAYYTFTHIPPEAIIDVKNV